MEAEFGSLGTGLIEFLSLGACTSSPFVRELPHAPCQAVSSHAFPSLWNSSIKHETEVKIAHFEVRTRFTVEQSKFT